MQFIINILHVHVYIHQAYELNHDNTLHAHVYINQVYELNHDKKVKFQGQGHRVKNNGTHGKVLSQGIFM